MKKLSAYTSNSISGSREELVLSIQALDHHFVVTTKESSYSQNIDHVVKLSAYTSNSISGSREELVLSIQALDHHFVVTTKESSYSQNIDHVV